MGSMLSSHTNKAGEREDYESSQLEACKRVRMSLSYSDENPRLIPNLPDEISLQILARMPRICYLNMKSVSRSWRAAVTSTEVFQLRREFGTAEEWLYILTKAKDNKLSWHAIDPLSMKWLRLPPMPSVVYKEEPKKGFSAYIWSNTIGFNIANTIRGWLGRKDSLERPPFCGSSIGAVDGCLYVLGGFSRDSALRCVYRYDPRVNLWDEATPMTTGRAFCKTCHLDNKLYVVGGVRRGRNGLTPLQTGEVFDPLTGLWTQIPDMPFSKAQALPTAFLAEMLKPIATGMTSYQGRLLVPQSLYTWPFFVDVGGEIYDPETDSWLEMPAGMGERWPTRQAGAKLSVVVNGELYSLDPSNSSDGCKLKIYNPKEDAWMAMIGNIPLHDFEDSESPYLLAGILGKLHVITKDIDNGTSILRAELLESRSTSLVLSPQRDNRDSTVEDGANVWKVVAAKDLGASELMGCEVLNI